MLLLVEQQRGCQSRAAHCAPMGHMQYFEVVRNTDNFIAATATLVVEDGVGGAVVGKILRRWTCLCVVAMPATLHFSLPEAAQSEDSSSSESDGFQAFSIISCHFS